MRAELLRIASCLLASLWDKSSHVEPSIGDRAASDRELDKIRSEKSGSTGWPIRLPSLPILRKSGATRTKNGEARTREENFLYLSIDEACGHVGSNTDCFRLVFGVFAEDTGRSIGTACSPPLRVLANNDVPGGAPHINE
ncbi:hypothetical protein WJX84_008808 [Apatococcus fuscideae]|uniref:Secreted protein n=1 Tax=Apatococcus fuscideae TaxID=2026836 RepID=A0AAW1SIX4_9CHLO